VFVSALRSPAIVYGNPKMMLRTRPLLFRSNPLVKRASRLYVLNMSFYSVIINRQHREMCADPPNTTTPEIIMNSTSRLVDPSIRTVGHGLTCQTSA